VTEFGYCSFEGTYGHAFGEDEHAKVIAAEFAAMDFPYVCGAAIWCWADHPWPAGRYVCGLAISPFGVVSRDRHKLKPFWTARAMFRSRQSLEAHADERTPSRTTQVIMVRPHMNDIPQALFPEGYGIRPMTTDDIGLWTDIQRDAEPYLQITPRIFRDEFGDDLEALERRCFIVTDPRGLGIGTVSAWYHRDFRGQDYGRIHWVAIRPSCQGKGLGKAALAYAMRRLAQWHERCYLVTSTERLQAIRMYLDFGFMPDLGRPSARITWSELSTRFKHPALDGLLG
jgi:GNAT superfamily N-acetyltransferase